ncbi:MAG: dCTP deaminase [Syntrophomonadaceae bacterium]|jgi:dCTP deaminase
MTVLNHQEILYYCKDPDWLENNPPLIEPCKEGNIKSASYDLRLGSQFYVFSNKEKDNQNRFEVSTLNNDQQIIIPPGEVCYAITKETLNMPNNISANLSLPLGLVLQGLMLSKQPPIDPGYRGGIICMLHNLSNDPVYIKAEAKILTIDFYKLSEPTDKPYDGKYQNQVLLGQYMTKPITSGLYSLRSKLSKTTSRINSLIPILLATLTIIVTILAFYVGYSTYQASKHQRKFEIIDVREQDSILRVKLPDGTVVNVPYEIENAKVNE